MAEIILKALALSVLEGLTEFIPVSSTGHLILAGHALQFPEPFAGSFEIAIQAGAILAVVTHNFSFFKQFLNPKNWINSESLTIITACIPAAILGVLIHDKIKAVLFNPVSVAVALILGGVLMIMVDRVRFSRRTEISPQPISSIGLRAALITGIFQCLSLWPGMSRSASSIIGGRVAGLSYRTAAQFSFIIAVPLISAASLFEIIKASSEITLSQMGLIGMGAGVSWVVAFFSIRWFLDILNRFKLAPFAYYRIGLGLLILLLERVL